MTTFNSYPAPWNTSTRDAIIGPDGNLWVVDGNGFVYKFDTTTFATTTYTVTGATALQNLTTDGTSIYASDQQATAGAFTAIYKISTSGVNAPFYDSPVADNAGAMYFDGTDIWLASFVAFRQINLTGTLVNSYGGLGATPNGRLLNDGTYWFVGDSTNGVNRCTTATPGVWTNTTTGLSGDPTYIGCFAAGSVWVGNLIDEIFSMAPGGSAFTGYAPAGLPGGSQSEQLAFDGTNLWATFNQGGIWQTTTGSPATGTSFGSLAASTILYDPLTNTVWATGTVGSTLDGFAYSTVLPTPGNQQVMVS